MARVDGREGKGCEWVSAASHCWHLISGEIAFRRYADSADILPDREICCHCGKIRTTTYTVEKNTIHGRFAPPDFEAHSQDVGECIHYESVSIEGQELSIAVREVLPEDRDKYQ